MKTVAIVQARMGSTRLPGKVLCDIAGQTMLARVIERLQRSERVNEIVVATTYEERDEPIVEESQRLGVPVFRGSEDDVLDRYYQAAVEHDAEVIVRVTSDCPLIDPEITDQVVRRLVEEEADYASNFLQRTFPRGLDVEAVTFSALEQSWHGASKAYQREHVTPFIYEHEDQFKASSVTTECDKSHHRWTVDTAEDLRFMRAVYANLEDPGPIRWHDVVAFLDKNPAIYEINQNVLQKSLKES